jgi:hypothetical protein
MSKHGLCIGIDYSGTSSELPDCVIDANRWAEALKARGFTVTTLLDSAATKAAMIAEIGELVAKLKYGDLGVLCYSGHGTWLADDDGDEADGRDEALCPSDVFTEGPLVDDDLGEIFSTRAMGARVLFISDSCFSGSVSRFAPSPQGSERRVRFMPPENFLKGEKLKGAKAVAGLRSTGRILAASASLLLSGSTDDEYSFSTGTGGAFTLAALASLEEMHSPADYLAWHRKIRTKLPTAEFPQNPMLTGPLFQKRWAVLGEGR